MSTQPHIPTFGYMPNQFTLHNASPERVDLRWGGVMFTLPGVDEIGPKAARDKDGDPIPGTLVLQDGLVPDKDGVLGGPGSPPNWLAFEAIRNLLGVDPVTKVATGQSAKAGLSFLPNAPSKAMVQTVRLDGIRRYEEHRLEWAQYTVATYEARLAAAKAAGVTAAPPDRDYAQAIILLKRHEAKLKAVVDLAGETTDDDALALASAKVMAMELAEKAAAGRDIDKTKLAEELLQDPKTRAYLMSKGYRIRKKGYLDVPDEPEQPQEG